MAFWQAQKPGTLIRMHSMGIRPLPLRFLPEQKNISSNFESLIADFGCVSVEAGYSGSKCIVKSEIIDNTEGKTMHKILRARQDTANDRIKNLHLLRHVYLHYVNTHRNVFFTVLNISERICRSGESNLYYVLSDVGTV